MTHVATTGSTKGPPFLRRVDPTDGRSGKRVVRLGNKLGQQQVNTIPPSSTTPSEPISLSVAVLRARPRAREPGCNHFESQGRGFDPCPAHKNRLQASRFGAGVETGVVWCAQTPAKQSAWSSVRTKRPSAPVWLEPCRGCRAGPGRGGRVRVPTHRPALMVRAARRSGCAARRRSRGRCRRAYRLGVEGPDSVLAGRSPCRLERWGFDRSPSAETWDQVSGRTRVVLSVSISEP